MIECENRCGQDARERKKMSSGTTVLVLLATYNGERYIREQIESILAQSDVEVSILISDDGSTDKTTEIINGYDGRCNNVHVIYNSTNSGGIANFLGLVRYAVNKMERFDYYAFADQDDFWLPEKLIKAVSALNKLNKDIPLLYCSRQTNCDENLKVLYTDFYPQWSRKDYAYSFLVNLPSAYACTMVLNYKLLQAMARIPLATKRWHDEWAMVLASMFGEVFADEGTYMLRRIHGDNVFGKKKSLFAKVQHRLFSWNRGPVFSEAARVILDTFKSCLSADDIKMVNTVATYREKLDTRIRLAFSKKIHGLSWKNDLFMRLKILFGRV